MVYLTGGAHLTNADLIKPRGMPATLFHAPMERDEAARTGLPTKNISDYNLNGILKEARGDQLKAAVIRYTCMFQELGITQGRVALYGRIEAGAAFALFNALQQAMPGITFVGEIGTSVLLQAMATKDAQEVARIRKMGEITTRVVAKVADFLTYQPARNGQLRNKDGSLVTIQQVKQKIDLWLAEEGAENPKGSIFAIGYDSAVPHSSGTLNDPLSLGKTIIFDIFPCEPGGGYFYDFTRTWCLGYAPDETQSLYEDVREAYQRAMNALRLGEPCQSYQKLVCDYFESRGHPTIQSNPQTQSGYVHGLGHGVGLNIHERPAFSAASPELERLEPGNVITIEPGLYYPDRGLGVRLEDSVYAHPDGMFEILAPFPLDLILPVKQIS
jgi:Xaa-Pro aminopeptidase